MDPNETLRREIGKEDRTVSETIGTTYAERAERAAARRQRESEMTWEELDANYWRGIEERQARRDAVRQAARQWDDQKARDAFWDGLFYYLIFAAGMIGLARQFFS